MNIIEAIQAAEQGALITNNFLKINNRFLKYIKSGVFYEYEIIDKKHVYKYEVREFSMGQILSIAWELVPNTFFKPEPKNDDEFFKSVEML